jgi:hypothetical protein
MQKRLPSGRYSRCGRAAPLSFGAPQLCCVDRQKKSREVCHAPLVLHTEGFFFGTEVLFEFELGLTYIERSFG